MFIIIEETIEGEKVGGGYFEPLRRSERRLFATEAERR
jgi:hypothetical protein